TASLANVTFETYVDDAAGWVKLLALDKRFSSITIAGHSEGALNGTNVAERLPVHAHVLLEGAGRPAPVVLREQLKPKLPPALFVQSDAVIAQLQAGHTVANPPPELSALFRPSVQPYLISWFKYDPAAELAKVRVPVTIVQGTADIQVNMTDAQALKHALPGAKLAVIDGMNHMLKYYPDHSTLQAAMKGYEDPSLPVDAKVVAAVENAAR
ncbi:MAG TPA: alpha/beta hydrolase, partial [Candidatus Baltobacteraceae bacterium]|nr:alpha/beta hydrolase [Candidatus Baltobacteraceae bacterium]